jgi:UDP-N-acetyl-D-mannosaminuronate dehydrogenase
MINIILTVIVIICLAIWTYFSIRQERKFNEMYEYIKAMGEQNDALALEYVKYVTTAIKNKQTPLRYSAWNTNIQ